MSIRQILAQVLQMGNKECEAVYSLHVEHVLDTVLKYFELWRK